MGCRENGVSRPLVRLHRYVLVETLGGQYNECKRHKYFKNFALNYLTNLEFYSIVRWLFEIEKERILGRLA